MATEDFLSCLSKAGIEKVGSSLGVLPRPRVKDTRAEVIKQAAGATYVHPAALFALTEAEIALHAEAPRQYSWENAEQDNGDEDLAEDGDGRRRRGTARRAAGRALRDDRVHEDGVGEDADLDAPRDEDAGATRDGNRRRRRSQPAAT